MTGGGLFLLAVCLSVIVLFGWIMFVDFAIDGYIRYDVKKKMPTIHRIAVAVDYDARETALQ